jgi:hypothetical protein
MLCYCPISGTNYRTDNFSGRWKGVVPQQHPIFSAPLDSLLQRSGDLVAGNLSPTENRLLFLALLFNTGQVSLEPGVCAEPSQQTILRNSEALIRFISWYDGVWKSRLFLPAIIIRHESRKIENIQHWLEAWNNAKETWENSKAARKSLEAHWQEETEQQRKEAALSRLIHSATKNPENYAGRLASWAMIAGKVPPDWREDWTKLFHLKGLDIFQAKNIDLQELVDHMEENLEVYHAPIFSTTVLSHVRRLLRMNSAGLGTWIETGDSTNGSGTPWSILDDEVEEHNKTVAISRYAPPEGSPRPSDPGAYPNRLAFLRAKAAWELQEARRVELETSLAAEAEKLSTETELMKLEEMDNPEEDLDQFPLDLPTPSIKRTEDHE